MARSARRVVDWPPRLQALFAGRILSFDEKAGLVWAERMADGKSNGRPRSDLETNIVALAIANDCIVITDNERDFAGIDIVKPIWGAA